MRQVKIAFLRDHLSAILASLRSQGEVTVLDRNDPVAIIYPAEEGRTEIQSARVARLIKEGVLTSAQGPVNARILETEPVQGVGQFSSSAIIEQDRQERV